MVRKHTYPAEQYSHHRIGQKIVSLYPQLLPYCHHLAQNKWDGEDIAQEVMVKVLKHYAHKDEISPALLKKMAYNLWIDTVRKRKHETTHTVTDFIADHNSPHSVMDEIDYLIRALTPKQAVIVLLKEGFQFQLKEIAAFLNTSETAVKASIQRARKRMEKKEGKEDFSNDLYWDEQERERLYELFQQTITSQDPTDLIQAIPSIRILTKEADVPSMRLRETYAYPNHSPSSTLTMAA